MVDGKKSSKDKKPEAVSESKEREDITSLKKDSSSNSINININIEKTSSGNIVQYSKVFVETNKKIIESLSNSSLPSLRNSVRKTMYEALLNKEELDGKILNKNKNNTSITFYI
jgi:hypothetical protein